MMREYRQFFIGGSWVDPSSGETFDVINPSTEEVAGTVAQGAAADVDAAVAAARKALPAWSATSVSERVSVLESLLAAYQARSADLAAALSEEMGAPGHLANGFQVGLGSGHLTTAIAVLKDFVFEEERGSTLIVKEPIGVCGLITPWNWPMNQIAVKVLPALATGCTMVLKPSERSPFTGQIFAEIIEASAVPAGVFNLVQGDGPSVGVPLSSHPGVDMVSFTGSTRAGIEIARNAAPTVKRVTQELGGKGPNIVLDDNAFAKSVTMGVKSMMGNSGQTCSAPSRMLVPASRMEEAASLAAAAAAEVTVGAPDSDAVIGPVVSASQFEKIQGLIQKGIDEGAHVAAGGVGRPDGLERGYFVKPTVFTDVKNDMTIARDEIFGPVLVIIGYDSIEHAVEIANDTLYGLASYVSGADLDQCRTIARQLRAGQVVINGAFDFCAPFGGYGQSGNGREWGEFGFTDYLETKGILGYA